MTHVDARQSDATKEQDVTTADTEIPTLTTVATATAMLNDLAQTHEWVSVFWDRGWGDSGQVAEISIIVDGNGQEPKAWLIHDVYNQLRADGVIAANSLKTFKARRIHDFKTPPPAPEPDVNPADVAETVIRGVLDAMPDKPVHAEFYRGPDPNSPLPRILKDIVQTPADYAAGFVLVLPGTREIAISAQVPEPFFGYSIVGRATCLSYPRTDSGDVDVEALRGDEFRAAFVAVIADRLAAIVAAGASL